MKPKPADFHVLIVDDNENNREILQRFLTREGYNLHLASGGQQALDIVSQIKIDLVLLDINMPDIDGIEVLRRIRADEKYMDVAIIMTTAQSDIESVKTCISLGCSEYLVKPYDMPKVKERIKYTLCIE